MNDVELLILVAKDWVVKIHGHNILGWSADTWWAAVEGQLNTFTADTIKTARLLYPDS